MKKEQPYKLEESFSDSKTRILYKIASRSRPNRLLGVLENIKNFSLIKNYVILCSLDDDDKTIIPIKDKILSYKNVVCFYGKSKSKIHAINRDIEKIDEWDIIFNVSDDQLFEVKGFDKIVDDEIKKTGNDVFLHFPDNYAGSSVSTMSIMGRKYYDRFRYIYHPEYTSLWCDNEATDVAKMLGKYHYVNMQIFRHNHPAFDRRYFDKQYEHTESFYHIDKSVYERRKAKGFTN